MESLFFDLIEILKQQNQTVSGLLSAAKEHNLALRNNDPAAIAAAVKKQEGLSKTLRDQDKKREEAQQLLAHQYGLEKRIVLSKLLPYVPVPTAAKDLEQLSKSLKESITQLAEINQLNGILAKRGLFFTEQLRRIILPMNNKTYLGSGELNNEGKPLSTIDKTI